MKAATRTIDAVGRHGTEIDAAAQPHVGSRRNQPALADRHARQVDTRTRACGRVEPCHPGKTFTEERSVSMKNRASMTRR